MSNLPTTTSDALASEIARLHNEAEVTQEGAHQSINDLVNARIMVATLAEKAKAELGQGFAKWWRDKGLPDDWDWRYIRIAKTKQRLMDDPRQLLMFAVQQDEGDDEVQQTRRPDDRTAWIKSVGKLRASLTPERIEDMTIDERETARMHLAPLIDLYNKLS